MEGFASSIGLTGATGGFVLGVGFGVGIGALIAWLMARNRHQRLSEDLRARLMASEIRRDADAERLAWIDNAEHHLRDSFDAVAMRALEKSTDGLLARSERQLGRLSDGVSRRIEGLEGELRSLESARTDAYAGLRREITLLRDAHGELRRSAAGLRTALASPNVRGRWGEAHLRRVVELAGMVAHVDFVEQPTVGGQRPDMIVHLPDGGVLPIDAKTPLEAFLRASEADDDTERDAGFDAHARALAGRVNELAGRGYWRQFEHAPDAVVLYVPNEAALASAFDRDPELLDRAFARRVLPTSPVTLLALLKTVAFGWKQQRINRSARAIAESGRLLHERLTTFVDHVGRIGRGLDQAVDAYNRSVGSLERRVLPAARRLGDHATTASEVASPEGIDRQARRPAARDSDSDAESASPGTASPGTPRVDAHKT